MSSKENPLFRLLQQIKNGKVIKVRFIHRKVKKAKFNPKGEK